MCDEWHACGAHDYPIWGIQAVGLGARELKVNNIHQLHT